jgi:hypothetical protein
MYILDAEGRLRGYDDGLLRVFFFLFFFFFPDARVFFLNPSLTCSGLWAAAAAVWAAADLPRRSVCVVREAPGRGAPRGGRRARGGGAARRGAAPQVDGAQVVREGAVTDLCFCPPLVVLLCCSLVELEDGWLVGWLARLRLQKRPFGPWALLLLLLLLLFFFCILGRRR